ncbi:hypothetical protein E1B28_005942 [Marasmius oreades]|uniref:Uncharacterized protein n=1 Tax=Marasmius oreades TaxID=181124 RepID=A0A9P7UV33_9AGAR|nr:uncharacterized protein E1B28_005942 [Marasmius oreades]KAG7095163.1 hypothetical protein E1B28_005942 [Marasmius oreades]
MPTPTSNDPFGIAHLQVRPSGLRTTGSHKRPRPATDDEETERQYSPPSLSSTSANRNVIQAAKQFAANKKLRREQIVEVEAFLNDTALGREARSYIIQLDLKNQIEKIVTQQAAWVPSESLQKNINHDVGTACLSPNLSAYMGSATSLIIERLISIGLDIPNTIHQNAAAYSALKDVISNAFTQRRSTMKKAIRSSIMRCNGDDSKVWAEMVPSECQTVIELAHALIKGTSCMVMPELCGRVAILRHCYAIKKGKSYWENVDGTLEKLRNIAKHDKEAINDLVKQMLQQDREKYGINNYEIDNMVQPSDMQHEIDELIGARNISAATENDDETREGEDHGLGDDDEEVQSGPSSHSTPLGLAG